LISLGETLLDPPGFSQKNQHGNASANRGNDDGEVMKSLLLIGAFCGTLIGVVFGVIREDSIETTFWHACAAAYLGALLMRWWGHAWRKSLTQSLEERKNPSPTTLNPLNAVQKTAKS
jgi:hypothetical protein